MLWVRYVVMVACLVMLGACDADPPGIQAATQAPAHTLPDGWRWESYMGVEVGVPDDWGWGSGGQRLSQWCINEKSPEPMVGRPGFSTAVGCSVAGSKLDGSTLIENTGWVVAFESVKLSDGTVNPIPDSGDRRLVQAGDTWVVVQAPKVLRDEIAKTVHEVTTDSNGCSVTDPISQHPEQRPQLSDDVAVLAGVTSVSVCRYALPWLGESLPRGGPTLLSSLRLRGMAATGLVRQIAAAPEGGGPDDPGSCSKESALGDEIIALRVSSESGASTIHVRYSGCERHGFDDGTVVRRLVRAPLQTIIAGPNAPMGWQGNLTQTLGLPLHDFS